MNKRGEIILSILYLKGKVWGRTYLQKLLYLLNREVFDNTLFDYKFHKYGPYSEDINVEITTLETERQIEEKAVLTKGLNTAYTYELTENGKKIASDIFIKKLSNKEREKLIEYINKFGSFSSTELLRYVYSKYPEVAENSIFEGF